MGAIIAPTQKEAPEEPCRFMQALGVAANEDLIFGRFAVTLEIQFTGVLQAEVSQEARFPDTRPGGRQAPLSHLFGG